MGQLKVINYGLVPSAHYTKNKILKIDRPVLCFSIFIYTNVKRIERQRDGKKRETQSDCERDEARKETARDIRDGGRSRLTEGDAVSRGTAATVPNRRAKIDLDGYNDDSDFLLGQFFWYRTMHLTFTLGS